MEFTIHNKGANNIAELKSNKQIINTLQDAVDLLGNTQYNIAQSTIIRKRESTPRLL